LICKIKDAFVLKEFEIKLCDF